MKVLHIAKHDTAGGACLASYGLHRGLVKLGVDSRISVLDKRSTDTAVLEFKADRDFRRKIIRKIGKKYGEIALRKYQRTRPPGAEFFSVDWGSHGREVFEQVGGADIVNVHWTSGFLDIPRFLNELEQNIPVVFTLHDMNSFTGGCHYSAGCAGFKEKCGACPQLGSCSTHDISARALTRKYKAVKTRSADTLRVVAPSQWMGAQASASAIFSGIRVEVIPYGVDLDLFMPLDQTLARKVLDIPEGLPVVAFVAGALGNRRKGFDVLAQALEILGSQLKGVHLLSIGTSGRSNTIPVKHVDIGLVSNHRLLAFCLSAADIFAMPTREDNLPNTVLEALSCGLPVVGTDVGGVPDMVESGTTGFIVPPENPEAFAEACRILLTNSDLRYSMRKNARKKAETEYSLGNQANAYMALYSDLL